jgi:hypothetical protein
MIIKSEKSFSPRSLQDDLVCSRSQTKEISNKAAAGRAAFYAGRRAIEPQKEQVSLKVTVCEEVGAPGSEEGRCQ